MTSGSPTGQLAQRIKQFSRGLLAVGVKPGDKVAVWLPNGIEWVVAVFSLANIGAIFVPVNTRFKTEELEYILKQSDSSALILADRFQKAEFMDMFLQLCPELPASGAWQSDLQPNPRSEDDYHGFLSKKSPGTYSYQELFQKGQEIDLKSVEDTVTPHQTVSILYTSGSTAFPKGVMLTHNNILRNGFEIGERLGLTREDRYFNPCPYYHNAGLVDGLLAALTHGSCNVTLAGFRRPGILISYGAGEMHRRGRDSDDVCENDGRTCLGPEEALAANGLDHRPSPDPQGYL